MKKVTQTLVATGVALGSMSFFAAPAEAAISHHSQDPQASGCANNAQTIYSQGLSGGGTLEVRYSPTCQTNWVRVSGQGAFAVGGSIRSYYIGLRGEGVVGFSGSRGQTYWSPMVYAPGSTCVLMQGTINPRDYNTSIPIPVTKLC